MKKENQRERRAKALEQKRLEFLTALDQHLIKLFDVAPGLDECRFEANQLVRLVRSAGLPVWTYSDSQICKVVGDSLYWNEGLLCGKNEYLSDGGRSGSVIFKRK